MTWLKAFHVVFVVTWFAGLFYLPRLFVYHVITDDGPGRARFELMERRLFAMMTLGGALAAGSGVHSQRWYRFFNEVPGLLLIAIVVLAVVKPWAGG